MSNSLSSFELAALAANLADDRKAHDILVLDTEAVSTLSDYFVIASVDSRTQMRALAEHAIKTFKQRHLEPYRQEIDPSGRWTILDFGDVVMHLFHAEDRAFYNLERFWSHATEVPRGNWLNERRRAS